MTKIYMYGHLPPRDEFMAAFQERNIGRFYEVHSDPRFSGVKVTADEMWRFLCSVANDPRVTGGDIALSEAMLYDLGFQWE